MDNRTLTFFGIYSGRHSARGLLRRLPACGRPSLSAFRSPTPPGWL